MASFRSVKLCMGYYQLTPEVFHCGLMGYSYLVKHLGCDHLGIETFDLQLELVSGNCLVLFDFKTT